MNITEVAGHSYTDLELTKLGRQSMKRRWMVSIVLENDSLYHTKWFPSVRAAKLAAMDYIRGRNKIWMPAMLPGQPEPTYEVSNDPSHYQAFLSNQADYNEEIELK
jgi:hypothetical protein